MLNFSSFAEIGANAAKALGITTAVGSAYLALGLPLPATTSYVDGKITAVISAVGDVKQTLLEGQLRNIQAQRALLRNEKGALLASISKAPDAAKPVFGRRLGEIEDVLAKLTREEETVANNVARGLAK